MLATGINPVIELPAGEYNITLIVQDSAENIATDSLIIERKIPFLRGDSNIDNGVDISDSINTLGYLFSGSGYVSCRDSADANDDGIVDISDPIFTLSFLFLGNNTIPQPYPSVGYDPTNDTLDCERYLKK